MTEKMLTEKKAFQSTPYFANSNTILRFILNIDSGKYSANDKLHNDVIVV